ncbi:MAG: hypothetical protein H6739_02985 [Alphaproteobacteria bacterium]|nr:hypothetical protein [Alphaproteobacteria bacterium]
MRRALTAPVLMWLALSGLVAGCTGKDDVTVDDSADDTSSGGDDTSSGGDDTSTERPETTAAGNIDLRDGTLTGTVAIAKAFSFYSNRQTFIYASSNPAATCDIIAELFDPRGDVVDKNDLFLPGHCNLTFTYVGAPPLAEYDIQTMSGAVQNAQCAYGEGSWVYDSQATFPDYYWSGDYYEAASWKGTFDISFLAEGEDDLVLNLALREWEGTFPYSSDRPGEHKASGRVDGVIVTEHCEGLDETGWF